MFNAVPTVTRETKRNINSKRNDLKMVRNILTILAPLQHTSIFAPNANQLLLIHTSRFIAWASNVSTD